MEKALQDYIQKFTAKAIAGDIKIEIDSPGVHFKFATPESKSLHYIASSTKLFTNTLIFQMVDHGRISLQSKVSDLLDIQDLRGLVEDQYLDLITVENLLSHTSGIADYFSDKVPKGSSLFEELVHQDRSWTYQDALERARLMKPVGIPNQKAHYSDTNYQLLGKVIENAHELSYAACIKKFICDPLKLDQTFVFHSPEQAHKISIMKFGNRELHIEEAMSSTQADGGIVSTTTESITFLKAYYFGQLFDPNLSDVQNQTWRKIFFPLEYGLGQMKYALPTFMSGFRKTNALFGHSGASGHIMFFDPKTTTFYAVTTNQAKDRGLVFRLVTNLQLRLPS